MAACAAILPDTTGKIHTLPADERIVWTVAPGDIVAPPTHLGERCGYVFAHADTYEEAWASASLLAQVLARDMTT